MLASCEISKPGGCRWQAPADTGKYQTAVLLFCFRDVPTLPCIEALLMGNSPCQVHKAQHNAQWPECRGSGLKDTCLLPGRFGASGSSSSSLDSSLGGGWGWVGEGAANSSCMAAIEGSADLHKPQQPSTPRSVHQVVSAMRRSSVHCREKNAKAGAKTPGNAAFTRSHSKKPVHCARSRHPPAFSTETAQGAEDKTLRRAAFSRSQPESLMRAVKSELKRISGLESLSHVSCFARACQSSSILRM